MFEFHYEGYTKEQCDAYLERIGATFDGSYTLESVANLIRRHQQSVPFENLSMCENWGSVNLHPDALFEKIVQNRRGGFCFELNGAFCLLLKGLGFDTAGVMARIGGADTTLLRPLFHRGTLLVLDGKEYYCDVGIGGAKSGRPVPLSGEKIEENGKCFWIEDVGRGWKIVRNNVRAEDASSVIFAPIPMLPFDFDGHCNTLVNSNDTIFHKGRIVNITNEDGYAKIDGQTFIVEKDGVKTERVYDESEFKDLLRDYFGIPVA